MCIACQLFKSKILHLTLLIPPPPPPPPAQATGREWPAANQDAPPGGQWHGPHPRGGSGQQVGWQTKEEEVKGQGEKQEGRQGQRQEEGMELIIWRVLSQNDLSAIFDIF